MFAYVNLFINLLELLGLGLRWRKREDGAGISASGAAGRPSLKGLESGQEERTDRKRVVVQER
jgi:hypothetical protein